eukprot:103825-Amorphochlora_amoeboformis.AAC.1
MAFFEQALAPSSVFLLKGVKLSLDDKLTLALGKSFRPLPNTRNSDTFSNFTVDNWSVFARRLRLTRHFGTASSNRAPKLYFRTGWQPGVRQREPNAEQYIVDTRKLLSMEATRLLHDHRLFVDMTQRDRNVRKIRLLTSKMKRVGYVATPADKNLGLVVMTAQDYEDSMLEHLNSSAFRRINLGDYKTRVHHAYTTICRTMGYMFPADEKGKRPNIYRYVCETYDADDLQPVRPYLLFKIHKLKKDALKARVKPPTRLLAPCMKTVGETAARWVDNLVSPVYRNNTPHDLRDTPALIRSLQVHTFPLTCTLSVKDIVALYPSIPLALGDRYFLRFLRRHFDKLRASRIYTIARTVLRNNILRYRDSYYLQVVGTAIGNPLAVVYANVFVSELTNGLVTKYIDSGVLLFYRRYIDDIFTVFTSPAAHHAFWREFDRLHASIRTTGGNAESVDFLDLTISKDARFAETGYLHIQPYTKPYNKFLYIPWSSYHTRQSKRAWIRAELQRIVRNSDNFELYLRERN